MPPTAVKTIRDEIYWQYAKLISKAAGFGIEKGRGFQMKRFKKLQSGEMKWSSTVREWLKEHEKSDQCVYCEKTDVPLTVEHILPLSLGGPDVPDNVIRVCKTCNSSKGDKRLYEWFTEENRDKVPRIAEGKYLKLLYDLHEKKGALDIDRNNLPCSECALKGKCISEGHEGKLTVYCIEGIFK